MEGVCILLARRRRADTDGDAARLTDYKRDEAQTYW